MSGNESVRPVNRIVDDRGRRWRRRRRQAEPERSARPDRCRPGPIETPFTILIQYGLYRPEGSRMLIIVNRVLPFFPVFATVSEIGVGGGGCYRARLALRHSAPSRLATKKTGDGSRERAIPGSFMWEGSIRLVVQRCVSAGPTYRANGLAPPRFEVGGGTGGVAGAAGPAEVLPAAPAAARAFEGPPGLADVCPGGLRSSGFDISVPGTKLLR